MRAMGPTEGPWAGQDPRRMSSAGTQNVRSNGLASGGTPTPRIRIGGVAFKFKKFIVVSLFDAKIKKMLPVRSGNQKLVESKR